MIKLKTLIFLCASLLTVGCFAQAAESPLVPPDRGGAKSIEATFISNCGFLVQVGEKNILFDLEEPQQEEIRQRRLGTVLYIVTLDAFGVRSRYHFSGPTRLQLSLQ